MNFRRLNGTLNYIINNKRILPGSDAYILLRGTDAAKNRTGYKLVFKSQNNHKKLNVIWLQIERAMKKILIALCMLAATSNSFAQSCEEREDKLLELMGSLSAGFLYNTYGLIGSIADGYGHDAYNATTVTDLLTAQKKLADNMIGLLEKIINEKTFKAEADKNYVSASVSVIKGFKTQIDQFLKLVKNKTQENLDAYDAQRSKNWKELSKLMGIEE